MERFAITSLALFVFAIPLENSVDLDLVSISRLIGLVALFSGTLSILKKGAIRQFHPFHYMFFALIVWIMIGYQWSIAPSLTLTRLITMVQIWMLTILIWNFVDSAKTIDQILLVFVLSMLIINSLMLMEFVQSGGDARRYFVVNANANGIAFYNALALSMAWLLGLKSHNKFVAILLRVSMVMAVISLILTGSRGGFLASLPAILFIATSWGFRDRRTILSISILSMITYIIVTNLLPPEQFERIISIPEELRQGTLANRTIIWAAGMDRLQEVWFWGAGFETYRAQGIGQSAHNTWISLLFGLGVVGIILFLLIILSALFSLRALPALERNFWISVFLSWLVYSLSSTVEHQKITWVMLILMIVSSAKYLDTKKNTRP